MAEPQQTASGTHVRGTVTVDMYVQDERAPEPVPEPVKPRPQAQKLGSVDTSYPRSMEGILRIISLVRKFINCCFGAVSSKTTGIRLCYDRYKVVCML